MQKRSILLAALLALSCGKPSPTTSSSDGGPSATKKPTAAEAQKMLDELWAQYPLTEPGAFVTDETQFKRVQVRKKIRAVLRHYPDWLPAGPKPGPTSPATPDATGWPLLTQAQLKEILKASEDYDAAH